MADYRNKDTVDEREIATTINSLGKYDKWYKKYAPTGCLILDEIRSILPVIDSPTLQDNNAIMLLDQLMKKCRYVIALDADLLVDNMVQDFLSSFGRFSLLKYTTQKMPRTVNFYNREEVWDNMFKVAVSEKKTLFASISTKRKATDLAQWCVRSKVPYKIYTGETFNNTDFSDPDKAWLGVQVIIATSTLTVAVDPQIWQCDVLMAHTDPLGHTI